MQRVPAGGGQVWIGAMLQEKVRQLPVRIRGGHDERTLPVRQRVVGMGARFEERANRIETPRPNGEQDRGESGGRWTREGVARFGHPTARFRGIVRSGVDVGASGDQHANRLRVVPGGRPHEGRLAARAVARVHVSPVVDQRPDGLPAAGACCGHQSGLSAGQRRVRIGARREQEVDDGCVAVDGRQ